MSVHIKSANGSNSTLVESLKPESELTRGFNRSEREALSELRTKLPQIFAEAYHTNSPNRDAEAISIWGVAIDPYASHQDGRVSVILMKFLRAKKLNVNETHAVLVETLRWRDRFKVDNIMEEKFPEDVFGKLSYISGSDKKGRPVNYNLYMGNINAIPAFSDIQRFVRWRVQVIESCIRLLDFETHDQFVQIDDYGAFNFNTSGGPPCPNHIAAMREASEAFGQHYPNVVGQAVMLGVPAFQRWTFWILFKTMFYPFASAANWCLIGTDQTEISATMLSLVPAYQLPKRYGGEAPDLS